MSHWQSQVVGACISLGALLQSVWSHLLLLGNVNGGMFTVCLTCFGGKKKNSGVFIPLASLALVERKQQQVYTRWLHLLWLQKEIGGMFALGLTCYIEHALF